MTTLFRTSPEFDLISRYFVRARASDSLLSIGDDAAVFQPPEGQSLVFSIDTLVEGRHFPPHFPASAVATRALGCAISDLAAMGAQPHHFTLSLTLPEFNEDWLLAFSTALHAMSDQLGVQLVGGDTTRGPLSVSVQVHGLIPNDQYIPRTGATVGDLVYVSGSLGDAAAGLRYTNLVSADGAFKSAADNELKLLKRFIQPEPRIELGLRLRGYANAAIDVSDGLLADAQQLAKASDVSIVVDIDRVPLSNALVDVVGKEKALSLALTGGDDYELLCAVTAHHEAYVHELGMTQIGRVEAFSMDKSLHLMRDGASVALPQNIGFDHFE